MSGLAPSGQAANRPSRYRALLVIGSHRSGTSLCAGILRALGVHMGADCGREHQESAFFREINVRALHSAGASWFRPAPLREALGRAPEFTALADAVRRATEAPARAGYFGQESSERVPRFADLDCLWGWKDPRTTLTLPLWLKVLGVLKVIHIVRNGIDVADSLIERERREPPHRFATMRYRLRSLRPSPWSEIKLRPFRNHREAFDLWAEYVARGVEATAAMDPHDVLTTRYEDLLSTPSRIIRQWADFAGAEAEQRVFDELARGVDPERRFAFLTCSELKRRYEQWADHPLMARFGYDRLSP